MTGASLGFGKTLLSASYNIFLMPVLTSMYNSRATTLVMRKCYMIREMILRKEKGGPYLSSHESGSI